MQADSRRDSVRRIGELAKRGGTWGADYAYALKSIQKGSLMKDVPAGFAQGNKRPVLVIPGVLENWTMMQPVAERLNAEGHPVHVLPELKRNTISIGDGARLAFGYLRAHDLSDVVIVAHSKGGLIGKRMLADDENGKLVRLIAIATPFVGSTLAPLIPVTSISTLGPNDPTIRALAQRVDINSKIVSIYPSFDPHIPEGSRLEGATNVPVEVMGHFRVLSDPEVLDAVVKYAS